MPAWRLAPLVGSESGGLVFALGDTADILMAPRLIADFNGLFGELLCIAHGDTCKDESGADVYLTEGMRVSVVEENYDEHNQRDDLVASGIVERAPDWLQCNGSRWVLRMDSPGVRLESDVHAAQQIAPADADEQRG